MAQHTASAWAASTQQTNYEAHNVGDEFVGSAATARWASTNSAAPHWLRADLGTSKIVKWYALTPGQFATSQDPTSWTFEGSDDASSWTTLDTRSSVTWTTHKAQTFTFSNSTAYRYYRVNISHVNGSTGTTTASVSDLRMGDGDPPSLLWSNQLHDGNIGGGFTLGVVFRPDVDGFITALRYLKGTTTTTVTLYLYDTDRNVLASTTHDPTTAPANTWVTVPITPVAVTSGTHYMVAEYNSTGHGKVSGNLTSAQTHGDLTILANGSASFDSLTSNPRYGTGTAFPTTTGTANYAPSVVFERPSGTPASVAAPVSAVSVAVPAPTVTAGASVSVAAPVLALSLALLAPTVSAGTSVTVAAPALALTVAAPAPSVEISTAAVVAAPTLAVSVAVPAPTVSAGTSVSVAAPALGLSTAVPEPTIVTDSGLSVAAPVAGLTVAVHPPYVIVGEDLSTTFNEVVLEDMLFVELTPETDLGVAVPILSEKHPSPELTALLPAHQAWVDYTPTTEVVGYAHIWVDDVDITYFRGKPTLVRNWTKEAPWGDKTAMWEMPQLDPWDVPGQGDLSFIRKGARVAIGIVDDVTGEVDRKWSGFYHARRKGFDSAEDYVFEAHGTMWAAMFQAIEPVPYQPPVDIGVLIPRLLNKLVGRPFNPIPETTTGILTRYRGARDERVWQSVQNILAREGWTDDGRQWTLAQVAEDEFRLVLKAPLSEVHGTVAWGNPGIDFDIVVDEDSRVDAVFCRWVKPGGGESANVFYPGLELLNGLPYPNSDAGVFLNLGTTDGSTTSGTGVTDLQEKLRDLAWTSLPVSGVITSAWVSVVRDVQEALDLTVDGSVGPQTWTAIFTTVDESINLDPRRLPLAFKSEAWPTKDGANGQILGDNPDFDGLPPNYQYLDMGTNITRDEVRAAARTYLAVHGEAVVTGTMRLRGCLDDLARTDIDVGHNIEVRGLDGSDVVAQVGRLSVDLDSSEGAYVVTVDIDERARDALTIDQILQRNRDALPDPARRPSNPNRSSRSVRDEGFSWDADSPCGKLTKTAVNGDVGLWTRRVIPFSEVGQLAGIRLHCTVPFAMVLFESLRFTPNMARDIIGNPFASTDPYRPVWNQLTPFGVLGAWGVQGDACGHSPGQESDGYGFTGDFTEGTTLEYRSETAVYVSVLLYARGDSGFVWGDDEDDGFLQARQT